MTTFPYERLQLLGEVGRKAEQPDQLLHVGEVFEPAGSGHAGGPEDLPRLAWLVLIDILALEGPVTIAQQFTAGAG